jgi:hypothetical protein
MTPQQIKLARHALGLPNARRQSYRNFFTAGVRHPDYYDWIAMVDDENAKKSTSAKPDGDDIFWLTVKGAQAALYTGESLDPEDFQSLRVSNAGEATKL